MGSSFSQEDFDRYSLQLYEQSPSQTCLFPDVGIDKLILKYSGLDSNAALKTQSADLLGMLPEYTSSFGSGFGELTSVPNAVGIGALVVSLVMELLIKTSDTSDSSYSMFQRVFGEEKASSVRDTMSEYVKRNRMFMANEQRLREELHRLEQQLSNHLTILRNSLMLDGQMSTRGFKIWNNGAAFHVQMLIHEARLNVLIGKSASDYVPTIQAAISVYLQQLDRLLQKYKTFKISMTKITYDPGMICMAIRCSPDSCTVDNKENGCSHDFKVNLGCDPCENSELIKAYVDHMFSKYSPVTGLKKYFSDAKNDLNTLIRQHSSFTLPAAA